MRKYIVLLIVNFILLIFQSSLLLEIFGAELNPNILFALAFSLILLDEHELAVLSGFIAGLLLDLNSNHIIGTSLLFVIIMIYITILFKKTFIRGWLFQLILLFLCVLFYKFIFSLNLFVLTAPVFYSGILTILISIAFYFVILRYQRKFLSIEFRIKA